MTYLLAQKALCPSKIILLRGNHEMRAQNSFPGYNPCFKQSCVSAFGPELGDSIWASVNAAFDVFPLAAVVDNSVRPYGSQYRRDIGGPYGLTGGPYERQRCFRRLSSRCRCRQLGRLARLTLPVRVEGFFFFTLVQVLEGP